MSWFVGGDFYCNYNDKLKSFDGLKTVKGDFNCIFTRSSKYILSENDLPLNSYIGGDINIYSE